MYLYVVFNGPVPDESWPQALDVVQRGAAQLGATDITTLVDRPGDHDVVIGGPDGGTVERDQSGRGAVGEVGLPVAPT
ncbi:Uncharacterised protein [Mycolicibacterium vanbaalenii]|uniref:Uncharacterized protein n=1 Tax=Mycolicibacterium vanbaalenii TaxID=110539 RepID=A0A5S9R858_MYCVN|nr:Uncharacterised protein [Mycolicibacterium vanbaalenii]